MVVLSIVQQKGGVGKTTLAVNLAGELRARGRRVVVVDADPQGSALAWGAPNKLGFEVTAEPLVGWKVAQWVRNVLKLRAEIIIIDTPAGLGPVFRAAVEAADLAIIPCGPSSLDLNAARQTLAQIATLLRSDARSTARIVAVPMRIDGESPEGRQLAQELTALCETVAPPLSQDIYFVRAFSQGVSVATAAPQSPAAGEMRRLTDFLMDRVGRTE